MFEFLGAGNGAGAAEAAGVDATTFLGAAFFAGAFFAGAFFFAVVSFDMCLSPDCLLFELLAATKCCVAWVQPTHQHWDDCCESGCSNIFWICIAGHVHGKSCGNARPHVRRQHCFICCT